MIILIAVVVVGVVSAPLVGVVLVSLASRREDSAHSLARRPSGALESAARRLVGFHGDTAARRRSGGRRSGGRGPARARRRPARNGGYLTGSEYLNQLELDHAGLDTAGLVGDEPDVPHLVG
jgi:hypothetical protein